MNERTPQTPPIILPLTAAISRPQWSVMIPAYNCSRYIKDTIESVLANDPGKELMQIEVIDDDSTDADLEALVKKIGKGRVSYFRQPRNVGSLRNFETCINRATGKWVHILHGDDKISEGFYREIESLFTTYPQAGAAFTAINYINENGEKLRVNDSVPINCGIVENWLTQIATGNLIQPPAIVVKREVYEKIGSFFAVHYGEDWEMWVRIAAGYPVAYSPKPLAMYRYLRTNSISSSSLRSGQNCKDIRKVINIINNYLPEQQRKKLARQAKRKYSNYFAYCAKLIYEEYGDTKAALYQARLAAAMDVNTITVLALVKLYIKFILAAVGMKGALQRKYARSV